MNVWTAMTGGRTDKDIGRIFKFMFVCNGIKLITIMLERNIS